VKLWACPGLEWDCFTSYFTTTIYCQTVALYALTDHSHFPTTTEQFSNHTEQDRLVSHRTAPKSRVQLILESQRQSVIQVRSVNRRFISKLELLTWHSDCSTRHYIIDSPFHGLANSRLNHQSIRGLRT
jgi:hypothetical protein